MASTTTLPKARRILRILPVSHGSHLLAIPRELRDKIYEYALVEPFLWYRRHEERCPLHDASIPHQWPLAITNMDKTSDAHYYEDPDHIDFYYHRLTRSHLTYAKLAACEKTCLKWPGIGLLLTCRQLYDEAASIFWSENIFCLVSGNNCAAMLGDNLCPPSVRAKVQKLSLRVETRNGSTHDSYTVRSLWDSINKLKSLTYLKLPPDLVQHGLRSMSGLPALTHLQATHVDGFEVFTGREDAWMWMATSFNVRRPTCETCHDVSCAECRTWLATTQEQLAAWYRGSWTRSRTRDEDVVSSCMGEALKRFGRQYDHDGDWTHDVYPAHDPNNHPLVLTVTAEGDSKREVEILGLPVATLTTRRCLRSRRGKPTAAVRSKPSNARKVRSQDAVEDDHGDITLQTLNRKKTNDKKGATRSAPMGTQDSLTIREDTLRARQEGLKLRDRHDAHASEDAAKKAQKDMCRAMRQLSLQKQAARKRVNR